MRFMSIALMSITLLIRPTLADCSNDCNTSCFNNLRTALHFRSQGANTARELVGWQWEINKPEMCENYGAAYIAFEFQRSFRDKQIARAMFGQTGLHFAGSAGNRSPPK